MDATHLRYTMSQRKVGRPKKYHSYTYFTMKVSPEVKEKIQTLAKSRGVTATDLVMGLIQELDDPKESSLAEQMTVQDLRSVPKYKRVMEEKQQTKKAIDGYEVIEDGFDISDTK